MPRVPIVSSPDGSLTVAFGLDGDGVARYEIRRHGEAVLGESRLGLVREDADFSRGLRLKGEEAVERVTDTYELLTSKRRHNTYAANRKILHLTTAAGQRMDIVFQASNDGLALRYVFPETDARVHRLREEATTFRFTPGTHAWLQPKAVARTGWAQTNPSYEEYYAQGIPVGTPSTLGAGWIFPALFQTGETWVLLSETGLGRTYCGTFLRDQSPAGEYAIGFTDPRETMSTGPVHPASTLPWATPWRLIVVGSLATIAESTLGTDLADPPAVAVTDAAEMPGKSSWSWPLLGDAGTTFETQQRYIDYAAEMGWKYCLIDALWDVQIGAVRIKELVAYARARNVRICLWYDSAGDWNTAPQTPRDKLLTPAGRRAEFAQLAALGVKGIKVDFFGGDGQSFMNYYQDILVDAARHGLAVNFHGSTLPRGWHRTYPHLMTMEAIRGFEYITFDQKNADAAPAHCTMLPFTRNVFDPMDFTPVCLDAINDRVKRRTTGAFELALAVLFTSGIQHYAETPEGMARQPEDVRAFLRQVPAIWEEVRFLDGFPGKYVALARRGGGRWYVAAINGQAVQQALTLDLSALGVRTGSVITDEPGEGPMNVAGFARRAVDVAGGKLELTLLPAGGAVAVFE